MTWLDFDVTSDNGTYTWSWKLGMEQNVGYYVPQYSVDGIHFTDAVKITTVDSSHSYQYSAALSLEGNTFFRVIEVDLDGHTMYSNDLKAFVIFAGTAGQKSNFFLEMVEPNLRIDAICNGIVHRPYCEWVIPFSGN